MKKVVLAFVALALMLTLQTSIARAGGGASYPLGAEDFMSGAFPPPGLYFDNYGYYYHGGDMKDEDGDDIAAFDELDVTAYVLRFIWISDKTFLGSQYGQHLFIPYLDVDLDFKVPVGPKAKSHYHDNGVPYLIYSPLIMGYHLMQGKLHIAISAVDLYIPMGQDDGNMATVGHNFWTFEPVAAFTYMPFGWKWAFSAKFMYDFNTEQKDCPTVYGFEVDRDPGQEFHFDYSISYGVTPHLRMGVNGYYYKQTTDDDYKLNATIPAPVQALLNADENNHSEVFAVGPGIWYNYKNMFFILRSQWEMGAESKTEGQNVWLKFIIKY